MMNSEDHAAAMLQAQLQRSGHRIVFAESCTAGLIAATLGQIPGISQWLAGSAVVYQLETKTAWLGVSPQTLHDPGPVSRQVSEQMALGVLKRTPHATFAASITGHLGPDAPVEQDGMAWSSIAIRTDTEVIAESRQLRLDEAGIAQTVPAIERRRIRQAHAVHLVMRFCTEILSNCQISPSSVVISPDESPAEAGQTTELAPEGRQPVGPDCPAPPSSSD